MVQTMSSLTLPRSSLLQGVPPVGEALPASERPLIKGIGIGIGIIIIY